MTWALVAWSALFLVWVIAGASEGASSASSCHTTLLQSAKDCQTATTAGATIGVAFIVFLWFLGFVPGALVWFMTKPKERA